MAAAPPPSADSLAPVASPTGGDGFLLGDWQVDVSGNRLLREGEVRPLRHKAMELLALLARHAGRTVTREEIVEAVWDGNQFVAPKAINTAVWTIRQALGDDPEAPRYLETIAKKGYRLIAPVAPWGPAETSSMAAPPLAPPSSVAARLPAADRRWMLGGVAAALALLVALGAGWWHARSGSGPRAPGASMDAQPTEVHVAQPEALTQEPGVEYLGALSPDGQHLAFAWWHGRGVGALHLRRLGTPAPGATPAAPAGPAASTSALSQGLGDVMSVAWAPDGRSLAFTTLRDGSRCTLWLQALPVAPTDAQRPPPRELAACAPLATPVLAWAPTSSPRTRTVDEPVPPIVFSAEREGAGGLFAIHPDGSGLRRLTTSAPLAMADQQPSWSSDGRALVFVREDPADGTRDFYEWRAGHEVKRLSQLKLYTVHGLTHAHGAAGEGADGDLIFSSTRQDTRMLLRWERRSGRVLPLGLEGSAPSRAADGSLVYALSRTHVSIARQAFHNSPVRVIQGVASDRAPRPDPSGTWLAFVSRRTGSTELWLAASDGSNARALTALGGVVGTPAWSPKGDRLAFIGSCGPGRRIGLCLLALDGSEPRPLATDAANYGEPVWHPAREEVWVASDRGGRWQLWRFAADGSGGQGVATEREPAGGLRWAADGSGFVYRAQGERALRWRQTEGQPERSLEVTATGEELVDWQLGKDGLITLTRSDRDRWRRLDLRSGRREALGELPLGTLPERARFALAGTDAVWVEVANTHGADLMRLR